MSTSKQEEFYGLLNKMGYLLEEQAGLTAKLCDVLRALRGTTLDTDVEVNPAPKAFAAFLDTLLLGVHEYNILNGRFDGSTRTKDEVLRMTGFDLVRLKNCGPKSMGRIRAALEEAGYEHRLDKGWDAPNSNSKSDKAYKKWLPILQLARQQDVPVSVAERWVTHGPEKYHAPI